MAVYWGRLPDFCINKRYCDRCLAFSKNATKRQVVIVRHGISGSSISMTVQYPVADG